MNFEEVLKKVKAGTATPEEIEFVQQRVLQARRALSGEPQIDFDEALAHVEDGSATDEERKYVEAQISEFLSDDSRMASAPIKEASGDDVKKAKKSFKKRYIIIPVCVLLVIIVALGAILGGVFGFAASSANKNMKFGLEHCKQSALDYVLANQQNFGVDPGTFKANQIRVEDVDRQFHYNDKKLGSSYYYYEIDVECSALIGAGMRPGVIELEVELRVNTVTGNVELIKYDIDRD